MNRHLAALLIVFLALPCGAAGSGERRQTGKTTNLQLEPKAGLPHQTVHFTIEAYGTRAAKAGQLLESTFLDFVDTMGLSSFDLGQKIRVVVFEGPYEFRSKTRSRGKLKVIDGALVTYEQPKVDAILTLGAAALLFNRFLDRKPATEEKWLLRGVVECVLVRRAGITMEEARERWRAHLKKARPTSIAGLMGKEAGIDDDDADALSTGKRSGNDAKRGVSSAASLVAFLNEWGGGLNFGFMMRELRAGKSLDQALQRAYPGKFRNFEELYNYWLINEVGSLTP